MIDPESRSLTRRYVIGLACLAVLAMGGYASIRLRTARGRNAAHVLNVAGRQRMLAQELAAEALAADVAPATRAARRAGLEESAREWQALQSELRTGDADDHVNPPSPAVARLLDSAQAGQARLVARARAVAAGGAGVSAVDALMDERARYVGLMDGVLSRLEGESRARVMGLERAQAAFLVVTLVVLLVEALLVFRPAVRRLARLLVELREAGEALADQNDRLGEQACEMEAQNEELVTTGEELARQTAEVLSAQEFLRTVVSSSHDAIVVLDGEQRYLEVNPQAERLLGRRRDGLVGRAAAELFPDAADERTRVARTLAEGRPHTVERVHRGADGPAGDGVFETTYSPLRDAAGAVVGAICVTRDATARKAYERALVIARDAAEEANRARGEFMARMNHELRTPLTVIIGFTRVLAHSAAQSLGTAERGYLERVDAHSRHLLALVNDVLDVAKIDAGEMDVERVPTDLARVAADTAGGFEVQAATKGLWLRTELGDGPAVIATDPTRLRQILTNLLGNAVKFTEAGGVTVRLVREGGALTLEVVDTGIGIPAARREAVFEAFEQADVATHRKYGGTGLGLSISRSLCELLGARLTLESEEGRGTTFRVTFPPTGEPCE